MLLSSGLFPKYSVGMQNTLASLLICSSSRPFLQLLTPSYQVDEACERSAKGGHEVEKVVVYDNGTALEVRPSARCSREELRFQTFCGACCASFGEPLGSSRSEPMYLYVAIIVRSLARRDSPTLLELP
jgi:hypothetical protein